MIKEKKETTKEEQQKLRDDAWESFSERITAWVGSTPSLIVHTVLFCLAFLLIFVGIGADRVLLVLTTIVSLEAVYLSIFIQMTVNKTTKSLQDVEEDIDDIQEEVSEDDVQDQKVGDHHQRALDQQVRGGGGAVRGGAGLMELAAVDRIKQEIERLKKMISSLGGHAATAKTRAVAIPNPPKTASPTSDE